MIAAIIDINRYRRIPTTTEQLAYRDMVTRIEVMKLYIGFPWQIVEAACEAASAALKRDASFIEAMDAAEHEVERQTQLMEQQS